MQRFQVAQPNRVVEGVKHDAKCSGGTQVVAGSEDVASVEADAHAGLVAHEVNDITQVGEGCAHDGAATGHGFEEGDDGFSGGVGGV